MTDLDEPTSADADEARAAQEIVSLLDESIAAHEAHDVCRIASFWDEHRPECVTLTVPGLAPFRGRSAALGALTALTLQTYSTQILVSDRFVAVEGDAAVATLVVDLVVIWTQGAPVEITTVTHTVVLRRRSEGWKIVSVVLTPMLQPDPNPYAP